MKKKAYFILPNLFISMLLFCSCYHPKQKENNEPEEKDTEVSKRDTIPTDQNESKVIEYNPLIKSNKYHLGYEKRKYSTLFSYEPTIRYQLPRIDLYSLDNSLDFITNPNNIPKEQLEYTKVNFKLSNCENEYQIDEIPAFVKIRGNFTFRQPKKPLSLKFEEKVGLLGLNNGNKFKKWILNATAIDFSNQRDRTAFYLGKQLFNYDKLFFTDSTFVELYANNQWWGIYLLQEKSQVNKNRVNIDDVEKRVPVSSYTGTDIGYLIEFDSQYNSQPQNFKFTLDYNGRPKMKYYNKTITNNISYKHCRIHSEIYNSNQRDFIKSFTDNVFTILYEAIYNKKYYEFNESYTALNRVYNTTSKDVISKVINIDSFACATLLEEIVVNYDIIGGNQFLQVDFSSNGDKKLAFSSFYDFDNGFGNHCDYTKATCWFNTSGLMTCNPNGENKHPWYLLLIHEDWFWDILRSKWNNLVEHGVLYNALHYIDEFKITYFDKMSLDYNKWKDVVVEADAATNARKRPSVHDYNINTKDFEEASDLLFRWVAKRFNTLNKYFGDESQLFTYELNN